MDSIATSHYPNRIHGRARRAFTLTELSGVVACAGVLGAIALAGFSAARRSAQAQFCAARLGALGASSAQFAAAHQGVFAGLTWEPGGNNSQFSDLNAQQAQGPLQAHAAQVVDLWRRRGRTDIAPIQNWIPDVFYATAALVEFEGRTLADPFNICPSDDYQNKWRRHPAAFDMGRFLPLQPGPGPSNKKIPYRASYTQAGAAFDRNQSVFTPEAVAARIEYQASNTNYAVAPNSNPGPSAMSLVAFPSAKAHFFDTADRHFAPTPLHGDHPDARQPVLFFDGSVRVVRAGDSARAWWPRRPEAEGPQSYTYMPQLWEPPTTNGQASQPYQDRFRWTRDGLLGRDF